MNDTSITTSHENLIKYEYENRDVCMIRSTVYAYDVGLAPEDELGP